MAGARMKLWLTCLVVALLVGMASAEVKTATSSNFDEIVRSTEVSFVKFYAPWCGHCKAMKPHFEEAADTLKDEATLAEVDCTVEKDLAKRFSIQGFPTLLIFREGEMVGKYEGPRDAKSLVQYVKSQMGPAVRTVASESDLEALKQEQENLCMIKTAEPTSALAQLVTPLANQLRGKFIFALITDPAIAPEAAMESITVLRPNGETETFTSAQAEKGAEALQQFLQVALTPFFGEINAQTFRNYMTNMPVGWLFFDKDCDEELKTTFVEVAKKYRDKIILCWVNADLYGAVGQQMALPADVKYPAFVIESDKRHNIQPQEPAINAESTSQFIADFLDGKVKPTLMSQPIPEVETEKGLTTLVGKSLPEHMKTGKNIFVFFYAPWCQHCKNLHPIYEQLAMSLQAPNLIIGKFDITTNNYDPDVFEVDGIPTLYFIPAGKKPILYEGDRTLEALTSFVEEHNGPSHVHRTAEQTTDETADEPASKEEPKENIEGDL